MRWFAGQIDLRFYDRILSVPEIQEFSQLGRRAPAPALQPWMLLALFIALMALGCVTIQLRLKRAPRRMASDE